MKHFVSRVSFFLSCIFLLALSAPLFSQDYSKMIFHDAKNFTLVGKGNPTSNYYHRVDTSRYPGLPKNVRRLLTNASGQAVLFKTNSKRIDAKWRLSSYNVGNNMTAIVHSGLDLYIKKDNRWEYAGVARPKGVESSYTLVDNMDDEEKECILYLPLYNTLESLEIGIEKNAHIIGAPTPFEKTIVIYGSSITQGASASRAGMSYTSRMARSLNWDFINLGLSGSGKMEKEVAHMVADIKADMYILDSAANPSPEEITERTNYIVKHIRSTHPNKPIVMIQSVVRETGNFDLKIRRLEEQKNINFAKEYNRLLSEGIKDLYLIEGKDLLPKDHEGTTDGTHPNDIGFSKMIEVIQPRLQEIMEKY